MREFFAAVEVDYANELRERQEVLDQLHRLMRDTGTSLAEDRRNLQDLKTEKRERYELHQKIASLRQFNAELEGQLSQGNGQLTNGVAEKVAIGEADRGLDFDGHLASVEQMEENIDLNEPLSADQRALISSLERPEVLRGRVKAYEQHNMALEKWAYELRCNDLTSEERYRKIVSLGTGVDIDRVDDMAGPLIEAVLSEQGESPQLDKVREFLQLVQGAN